MAAKTISDIGATAASYEIRREDLLTTVRIRTSDGDEEAIHLSRDEVLAIGTPSQRQTVADWFDNGLYAAALAKAGFTE